MRAHDALVLRRAAILVVVSAALAAFASSSNLHEALLNALLATDEIIDEHVVAGAIAFVIFAAVSAMFAFVSVAFVIPAVVFAWGTPSAVGLLWLGWILGGVATYSIGRFLGRPVVRWLATEDVLHRWERQIPRNAPIWLIVLLQLALPSEIPGYVLGLLRFPFSQCLLAIAIAELPYALATVYLGVNFVEGHGALILGGGMLIAVFGVVAFWFLRKALARAATDAAHAAQLRPAPFNSRRNAQE
jgi:uncharacterized membrane protein YdjX (TVP38/TMEM64 family)